VKLGGLLPLSLSDYPGLVAAVVFTQGCNFRCPFCHNGNLIPLNKRACDLLREDEVFDLLRRRRGRLDGVVVSGGEPTMQTDLSEFLQRLKDLDYAVKLDTNGSRPDVLSDLLARRLVDYVAMDIKAPLPAYERLAGVPVDVAAIRASIALMAGSRIDHEFRTTAVDPLLSVEELDEIRRLVPNGSTYRVQPFRPEHARAQWLRGVARTKALCRKCPRSHPTPIATGGYLNEH